MDNKESCISILPVKGLSLAAFVLFCTDINPPGVSEGNLSHSLHHLYGKLKVRMPENF